MRRSVRVSSVGAVSVLALLASAGLVNGQSFVNVGTVANVSPNSAVESRNFDPSTDYSFTNTETGRMLVFGDGSNAIRIRATTSPTGAVNGQIVVVNEGLLETGLVEGAAGSTDFTGQHAIVIQVGNSSRNPSVNVINSGRIATHNTFSHGISIEHGPSAPGVIVVDNAAGLIELLSTAEGGGGLGHGISINAGVADVDIDAGEILHAGPGNAIDINNGTNVVVRSQLDSQIRTANGHGINILQQDGFTTIDLAGQVNVAGRGNSGVIASVGLAGPFAVNSSHSAHIRSSASIVASGYGGRGLVHLGARTLEVNVDGAITALGELGAGLFAGASGSTTISIGADGRLSGGWQVQPSDSIFKDDVTTQAAGLIYYGSQTSIDNAGAIGAGSDLAIRDALDAGMALTGPLQLANSGEITGYIRVDADELGAISNSGRFISRHFADTTGDGVRDMRRVAISDFGSSASSFSNSGLLALGASDDEVSFDATGYVVPTAGAGQTQLDASVYDFARSGLLQTQFLNTGVFENSGIIDLRGSAVGNSLLITNSDNGATIGTGNFVANGGIIYLNAVLNAGLDSTGTQGSQADMLILDRVVAGTAPTMLSVTNVGGQGAVTRGNGIVLISVRDDANSAPGAFALVGDIVHEGAPAIVQGAYSYKLYQGGLGADAADGDWYLRSQLTDPTPDGGDKGPLYQPGSPIYESFGQHLLALSQMPTLRQRLGLSSETTSEGVDAWARLEGDWSRITPNMSTTGVSYSASQGQIEIGAQNALYSNDSGALVAGLSGRYGQRTTSVSSPHGDGTISTQFASLGVHATWFDQGGFYLDNQASVTWGWSDLSSSTVGRSLAEGVTNWSVALSSEIGQEIALDDNWTLTPQAQLSYVRTQAQDFTDTFGVSVAPALAEDLTLRLGVSLDYDHSWVDAQGREFVANAYGLANVKVKLLDTKVSTNVGGTSLSQDNSRVSAEVGVGGSINIDKNVTLFGEALIGTSLTASDAVYGAAKIGFRVAF